MKCRREERQKAVELKRHTLWEGQTHIQSPLCCFLATGPQGLEQVISALWASVFTSVK